MIRYRQLIRSGWRRDGEINRRRSQCLNQFQVIDGDSCYVVVVFVAGDRIGAVAVAASLAIARSARTGGLSVISLVVVRRRVFIGKWTGRRVVRVGWIAVAVRRITVAIEVRDLGPVFERTCRVFDDQRDRNEYRLANIQRPVDDGNRSRRVGDIPSVWERWATCGSRNGCSAGAIRWGEGKDCSVDVVGDVEVLDGIALVGDLHQEVNRRHTGSHPVRTGHECRIDGLI